MARVTTGDIRLRWTKYTNIGLTAELTRDSFDTLSPTLASNSKRLLSASLDFSSAN